MSFGVLVSDSMTPKNASSNDNGVSRRSAGFHPSVWKDYFLSYLTNTLEEDDKVTKQLEELKEEVRSMFGSALKSLEKLKLIDSIQRLGLSYHFEKEINEILEHIKDPCNVHDDEDINFVALRFRLLRQQGYFVSCEIFNKFINVKDESGILSLYEASQLRINGENILDKALAFTTAHLQTMAMDPNSLLADEAKYALKWPIYKAMPRFMTRHYISLYDKHPLKNNVLLTFAKLDYNALQKLHQKEVAESSRWWKDLKLMEKSSFARDRMVECYVWALGIYYEPKYSDARRILTKLLTLISVLDDMYDVYATLDELQLFTAAIQRWDVNCIEKLPDYMKCLYEAILEFYRELEQDIWKDNNNIPFAFDYAKEAMKRQCKAYLMEAKWFNEGHVSTMEEYMEVATISANYYLIASVSFLALGNNVTSKEVIQWAQSDPMLLKAAGVICRLMNDINSHKFERERGHAASAVECYMKQYGVSEDEAVYELKKQVIKAWKDITQDYMKYSTKIPNVILDCVLNVARLTDLFYKEGDGYTFAETETKHFITLMLIDPLSI